MADPKELRRLASLVEKEAGRAADVLVGCAVRFVPDSPGCDWARADHWRFVPVPRISERIGCADKDGNVAAHWEAPGYTTDLTAARSLLPAGCDYRLDVRRGYAEAEVLAEWSTEPIGTSRAPTAPQALTASFLRAEAARIEGGSDNG